MFTKLMVKTITNKGGFHLEKENSKPKTYGYARVSSRQQATEGNSLEAQEGTLRDAGADIIEYTGPKYNVNPE